MKKNIILKEVQKGKGVYSIEVNPDAAPKIKGNNHNERINNAVKDILRSLNIGFQVKGNQP